MRVYKYSADTASKACEMHSNGSKLNEIASSLGVSRSTAYRMIRLGDDYRPVGEFKFSLGKETINTIANRALAGEKLVDIAKDFGISKQRVHQIKRSAMRAMEASSGKED